MTMLSLGGESPYAASPTFSVRGLLTRWLRRVRERRELMQMSDHDLSDIAITRTDAWREAEKPFWKD
jgi:uncharacterized protein YjiS (DUF1127 family)